MEFPFDKIKPHVAVVIMMNIAAVIAGFVFLYLFHRKLFYELDIFRLVVLS